MNKQIKKEIETAYEHFNRRYWERFTRSIPFNMYMEWYVSKHDIKKITKENRFEKRVEDDMIIVFIRRACWEYPVTVYPKVIRKKKINEQRSHRD
jgi:hypothetical protein